MDKTVTISRKQADDAIAAERVLAAILNDADLDVTVNVGGYLVISTPSLVGWEWEVDDTFIHLTPEQLDLCQRLQARSEA